MPVYSVTTNLLCCGHSIGVVYIAFLLGVQCPPHDLVGEEVGGGSYKTTAFIHGAFNSELGVDKSEGAGMHSLEMRTSLLPLGWGPDTSPLSLCQRRCGRASPLDIALIYPWTVEVGARGQAIVLDPQEKRTVADCGHNALDVHLRDKAK